MSELSPSERSMFHATEKFEAGQRVIREAAREITKAMVAMRRERRSEDDS
jgi:hypothetical protein